MLQRTAYIRSIPHIGLSMILLVAALALAGCGGGTNNPPGAPPPGGPTISPELTALLAPGQQNGKATFVGAAVCGQCHGAAAAAQVKLQQKSAGLTSKSRQQPVVPGQGFYQSWLSTKHASIGVSCESCHGPGSAHVAAVAAGTDDPTQTLVGYPNITSALVCGQCHKASISANLAEFTDWTGSPHRPMVSAVLAETLPTSASSIQTCGQCHNAVVRDSVLVPGDDITALTQTQIANFANFTQAQAAAGDPNYLVSTANCASCHNPHAKTGNAIDSEGDDSQVIHQLNIPPESSEFSVIGAGSTTYTSLDHACGTCHNSRGANPADTALKASGSLSRAPFHEGPQMNMLIGLSGVGPNGGQATQEYSTHALAPQQCATCHMQNGQTGVHSHSFLVNLNACVTCHTSGDVSSLLQTLENEIGTDLANLNSRMSNWASNAGLGATGWDYSSNGGTSAQSTLPIQILRARYNYYFIVNDRSLGVHNDKYTRDLIAYANQQLDAIAAPAPTVVVTPSVINSYRSPLVRSYLP